MLLSTSTTKIKLEIFLKPFTQNIWYFSAVFMVIFIFAMRIIMRREETGSREKYSGAMLLIVGIIAQQGKVLLN